MKQIKKTYDVFTFDELDERGKERAINDEIDFYLEMDYDANPFRDAIDKAEEMRTPWFCGSYIYDYHKDEILEGLRANGAHYLKDGSFFAE